VADLVLRRECAGCGCPATPWCASCSATLLLEPRLQHLRASDRTRLPVWSTTEYRDEVRSGVVAWKDRGRADLTGVLGPALRRAVLAALDDDGDRRGSRPLLLVPAPSSRRARRERGHDPARDLARACAAGLRRRGIAVQVVPALVQARRVADQAGLGLADRTANLAGALRVAAGWRGHLRSRECLVGDVVVTTGATLRECVRALEDAGAVVVAAATVATTPRRAAGAGRDR
jgi:predicted amidophosphoribosyltransferase